MKKKTFILIAVSFVLLGTSTASFSTTLASYQFMINGEQLMMDLYTFSGSDGSTPVENEIYNGARAFWSEADQTYYLTYQDSSVNDFRVWISSADRLVDFNLWGYGGDQGTYWGETYKVYAWDSPNATNPNWTGWITPWPWGSFDAYADGISGYGAHYNQGQLLGWETDSYAHGLGFEPGESAVEFSFVMTLDLDDPAFGGSSPWYQGQEGQLVAWFGGSTMSASGQITGSYEGNIILQGERLPSVPEPATILLLGTGLLGLASTTIRKK